MTTRRGDSYTVTLDAEPGVVVYTWEPGTAVTEALAAAALADQVVLCEDRRYPVLVRMAGMRSMDRDARLVFTHGPAAVTSRVAMLAESPVQRVIANFFLGLSRNLTVPTRMFTDERQALRWLRDPE